MANNLENINAKSKISFQTVNNIGSKNAIPNVQPYNALHLSDKSIFTVRGEIITFLNFYLCENN